MLTILERSGRGLTVGRVAVKKSGRACVRYNVSKESVQTEMENAEQVHAGKKRKRAAFEAVKVEYVVRRGLVAEVTLWEKQKRVNEDVEARAKAEARRYKKSDELHICDARWIRGRRGWRRTLESIRRIRRRRWWRWRERSLARLRG